VAAAATVGGWGNSYAMSGGTGYGGMGYGPNGWYGNWGTYAARNGISCRPGTYFKGADGFQHLCQ
jgi:hypothetical protein